MELPLTTRPRRSKLRLRHSFAALAALISLPLAVAACGSSSNGAAQGTSTTLSTSGGSSGGSSQNGTTTAQALAFAQCMRSHGISNFPDPSGTGGPQTAPSGLNPSSPQFLSAQNACRSLEPAGNAGASSQNQAKLLKFSQCMRSHGISDFPDPNSSGGFAASPGGDLNPNNPQFTAAQQACRSLLTGSS
jgi:hypothetical protein